MQETSRPFDTRRGPVPVAGPTGPPARDQRPPAEDLRPLEPPGGLFIFWGGTDVAGIGEKQICVQDSGISAGTAGNTAGLTRPGVAATENGLSLCANHPSTWQRTLNVLVQLPSWTETFGALMLLWCAQRLRRHDGAAGQGARLAHQRTTDPWTLLLTGLGALTVARILTIGTAMHAELEVTV
jgi:hypothetical protein